MRFREFRIVNEDVTTQRASIELSQAIVDYVNANPKLAKAGTTFNLKDIPAAQKILDGFAKYTKVNNSITGISDLINNTQITFEHLPPRVNGYWNETRKVIALNPDKFDPKVTSVLGYAPNKKAVGSTLTHELQHGLDYFSGAQMGRLPMQIDVNALNRELAKVGGDPAKLSTEMAMRYNYFNNDPYWRKQIGKPYNPNVATSYDRPQYMKDPIEVNARLTQGMDDFARAVQGPEAEKWINSYKAMPELTIKQLFQAHNIEDLFPKGVNDPEYKKLLKRAAKFMDMELRYPSNISALRNPTFMQKVIGFLTGVDATNPAEILPRGSGAVKAAIRRVFVAPDAVLEKLVIGKLTKQAASTLFKSIPYIGWGIAAILAGDRLLKGDPTGAGLELASGAGGFVTAIPTMATICARDLYGECYQDPETGQMAKLEQDMVSDPQGTQQRISDLASKIQTTIKSKVDAYIQAAKK